MKTMMIMMAMLAIIPKAEELKEPEYGVARLVYGIRTGEKVFATTYGVDPDDIVIYKSVLITTDDERKDVIAISKAVECDYVSNGYIYDNIACIYLED